MRRRRRVLSGLRNSLWINSFFALTWPNIKRELKSNLACSSMVVDPILILLLIISNPKQQNKQGFNATETFQFHLAANFDLRSNSLTKLLNQLRQIERFVLFLQSFTGFTGLITRAPKRKPKQGQNNRQDRILFFVPSNLLRWAFKSKVWVIHKKSKSPQTTLQAQTEFGERKKLQVRSIDKSIDLTAYMGPTKLFYFSESQETVYHSNL